MSATSNPPRNFLPFALPDIDEREIAAVRDVLTSGWLTTGPKAKAFEEAFRSAVGARHAIAVNSCTAALHLSLEASGIQAGDEVVTTPYTFAASGEVIRYFDAKPVLADIDPLTLNLDPARAEEAITPRTKAIIVVHIGGLPAEMDAFRSIAAKHGIALIEDAAHAFPARYRGTTIGTLSDFTCFSFYATKTITTGEGGMICTEDDEAAERCRRMALHGLSRNAWGRYLRGGAWRYEILDAGFKYNMTDVAAAMGLAQLGKADAMLARRTSIAEQYDRAFSGISDFIEKPPRAEHSSHAWHLYAVRIHPDRLRISRDELIAQLGDRGIGCSVHFIPLHLHPYYVAQYGYTPASFPHATAQFEREISLPIYSRMSNDDVVYVAETVVDIVRSNAV